MVTSAINRNSTGIDSSTSTIRISTESTQPPKKPEIAPNRVPNTVATRADKSPTINDA